MAAAATTDMSLALLAAVLAWCVVVLGTYVRLSDAGLGCPDWPGCYGRMLVPEEAAAVDQANRAYPGRPLEHGKAWKEMAHRYLAGALGLIILLLAFRAWFLRLRGRRVKTLVPTLLLALVLFQAALGMWTVTLLLKPLVVAAHLLGGLIILSCLYWLALSAEAPTEKHRRGPLTPWVAAALVILFCQIALGGWTSANYAALVCTDFPTCQGRWWPAMDFREAFVLWRGLGIDYEGGVLAGPARTAIHVSHRLGALITTAAIIVVAVRAILSAYGPLVAGGAIALLLLGVQVALGIANVLLLLPLPVAVAHNGAAALLWLSLINLLYFSLAGKRGD